MVVNKRYSIWRYHKCLQQENQSKKSVIIRLFTAIIIFTVFTVAAIIFFMKYKGVDFPGDKILLCALSTLVPVVILLFFFSLYKFSVNAQGVNFAFARDDEGRMYVFDLKEDCFLQLFYGQYNRRQTIRFVIDTVFTSLIGNADDKYYVNGSKTMAKLINFIDENRILELIMENGLMLSYGFRIIGVKDAKAKNDVCTLTLTDGMDNIYSERVIVSSNYKNYNRLVKFLSMLK